MNVADVPSCLPSGTPIGKGHLRGCGNFTPVLPRFEAQLSASPRDSRFLSRYKNHRVEGPLRLAWKLLGQKPVRALVKLASEFFVDRSIVK